MSPVLLPMECAYSHRMPGRCSVEGAAAENASIWDTRAYMGQMMSCCRICGSWKSYWQVEKALPKLGSTLQKVCGQPSDNRGVGDSR